MELRILNTAQVAKALGVCRATVLRLVHQRLLRPLPGIRTRRFTEAEVARYAAQPAAQQPASKPNSGLRRRSPLCPA